MPLEIFFEIFMHLEPGDLLQLARTSKDLQNVLMRKLSKSIWHTACNNVEPGLLKIPSDMSEPEYAHLLFFDNYCHVSHQCHPQQDTKMSARNACAKALGK
ncbi:hypothetical protein BT96DRAFT_839664 [Gymnopus androsaceus JB14]|uniref:F-box domain-containing protein n=1 Tax=Gymnopus androsaceus JB14 TaxID=1447944 RepID=A0A6A4GLF8_9AGAR|nr:hypothetical protein BT96DRAFT_839664 [Gymnopus androsaceus JB14]